MIMRMAVLGSFCFCIVFVVLLITHFAGGFNSFYSSYWRDSNEYERRLTLFDALSEQSRGIVFVGDSITYAGPWSELFPKSQTHNFGIDGDTTEGLLGRIDAIVLRRPSKVFLMIGTNDLSLEFSEQEIIKNILETSRQLRTVSSETEVYIQSILPRDIEFREKIESLNKKLQDSLPSEVTWINLYPHFLDAEGEAIAPEFSNDDLHLTGNGYLLWRELITDHVNNKGRSSVMKLARARINPIPESEWTVAQRRYLEPIKGKAPFYNISATLARHIEAAEKFNVWAYHVMGDSSKLDGRHREILILRVGWLCDSEYEWGQHKIFAKNEGLSDEEIERIKIGSQADDWSDIERALLDAADELHENSFVSDQTWEALSKQYTEQQMMDLVFTVGQYHMVSMALNSFGVQLDDGVAGF